jgi:hypothetical protein
MLLNLPSLLLPQQHSTLPISTTPTLPSYLTHSQNLAITRTKHNTMQISLPIILTAGVLLATPITSIAIPHPTQATAITTNSTTCDLESNFKNCTATLAHKPEGMNEKGFWHDLGNFFSILFNP